MKCPHCGFDGDFKKASPRFFVLDAFAWLVENDRARRSSVCPKCGTTITLPEGMSLPRVLLIIILVVIVGAILYINR